MSTYCSFKPLSLFDTYLFIMVHLRYLTVAQDSPIEWNVFTRRIRCSFIFQFLVYAATENKQIEENSKFSLHSNGLAFGDMSQCEEGEWNIGTLWTVITWSVNHRCFNLLSASPGVLSEAMAYNKACRRIVYTDSIGTYSNITHG